MKGSYIFKILV